MTKNIKQPQPGVSFIIPAYNCEQTICETIDSIVESNYTKRDEIVITNDGSEDGTLDVIKKMQSKYPSIKVINHSENRGGGAARNSTIKHSKAFIFCNHSRLCLIPSILIDLKPQKRAFLEHNYNYFRN